MTENTPTEPTRPAGPKQLFRARDDRMLAGVAGGLGRYFDVDPLIFRIGFAVTAFFGGIGVFAYVAALLFVPADGDESARPSRAVIVAAVAAIVLIVAIQAPFGPWWIFDPGAWIGVAVIGTLGAGAFLLVRALMGRGPATPGRLLAYVVLSFVALCAACVLAFLSAWAGAEGLGEIVAVAVLVCGAGLVVGAFTGAKWSRWLVVPALVMAAPLGAVAAADVEFEGGYGERYHRPGSIAALPSGGYELAAGQMVVDLRDLEWRRGQAIDLEVDVGAGEALVIVPEEVCVETDAHVTGGVIDVRGDEASGVDVDHDLRQGPSPAPRLRLESDIAFGELRVSDGRFGELDLDGGHGFGGRFDRFYDDDDARERAAAADACEA